MSLWRRRSKSSPRPPLASRYRPQVEALEHRNLPAFTVGPTVDIGPVAGAQTEASIAINPTNPNNLVAFSNDSSVFAGIRLYVSNDAGATWTNRVIAAGDGLGVAACCDAQAAFDQFGNLFMAYLDNPFPSPIVIRVLLSIDGGASFRLLSTFRARIGEDQPSIATGANSVWVSYQDDFGTISARGAAVFGKGLVGQFIRPEAAPGSREGSFGNVAIGPNGQVLVTYQVPVDSQGPSIIRVNLDPDGLGPARFGQAVTVTATQVGGFDFIPAQIRRSVDAEANLVWDRSLGPHRGRVYLVYTDEIGPESNNLDLFVRFSDTNGLFWGPPIRVNDDTGASSQFFPQIAIDQQSGLLAVAWYDARNAGVANNTTQIFASASIDGGVTFAPNLLVSAGTSNSALSSDPIDFGDYFTMEFVNGVFYPIWADNSTGLTANPDSPNLDIATAKVTFDASTPEQQAYLTRLFNDVVNRNPTASESLIFGNMLAGGVARTNVVNMLLTSTDYRRRVVNELYLKFLKRPVDNAGRDFWVGFLAAGGTNEQLAAILIGSPEYFEDRGGNTNSGFLDAVYLDLFNRAPDADGKAFFLQLLGKGISRTQVATFLLASTEYFERLVNGFFVDFLNRPADEAGLAFFVGLLQKGVFRDETVIAILLASDEYFNLP